MRRSILLVPSGSLPGVILRPLSFGDRLLVGWLSPRVRRCGGAYLVQTDALQADVGRHGGSEVAQPLQPQHSSRQARSRSLANRSAPATRTKQVAWQRLSTTGMLMLAYTGGTTTSTAPACQMQQAHRRVTVTHSTSIPELACLGAIHVQLKGPRICPHVAI